MFTEFDRLAMTRALALAERGLETTHPNPRVGCVIARGDRIIGEGFHERAGEPHAEVMALRSAKEPVAGATAYVTLEPCSHHGRTPPCVNALIEARIARVVFAVQDPNPRVSGQGADALLRAGITVEAGLMETEATELNIGFMKRMKDGLPWVRVKLAMSLDGRTALANGASQWITGEAARADVQRWRARCSAIMTGIGTVLADDPRLNVRMPGFKGCQPLRVVLDARLRSPVEAKVFAVGGVEVTGSAGSAAGGAAPGGCGGAGDGVGAAGGSGAAGGAALGAGQVVVFAAAGGGGSAVTRAARSAPVDRSMVADGVAELVSAFETSPTSVAAREAGLAGQANVESDVRSSSASAAVGSGGKAPAPTLAPGAASTAAASSGSAGSVVPVVPASAEHGAADKGSANVVAPPVLAAAGSVAGVAPAADDATWAGAALSGAIPVSREPSVAGGGGPTAPAVSTARAAPAVAPSSGSAPDVSATSVSPPAAASQAAAVSPAGAAWLAAAASPAGAVSPAGAASPTAAARLAPTASPAAPSTRAISDSPAAFQVRKAALFAQGVRIEEVPSDDGYLDLSAVLKKLGEMEVNEVLVEAGPTLAGQLLTTFLVDELLLYVAPKLLGPQGRPLVNLPELQSLQDAWGFSLFDAKRFGDDLRLRMRPK